MTRSGKALADAQLQAYGYAEVNGKVVRLAPLPPTRAVREVGRGPAPVRLPEDRYKSQLERRYAQHLDLLRHESVVLRWEYEPLKVRLADNCFYSPDFLVIYSSNTAVIELHEVKGNWWREDARIKIKVAAEQFPYFQFRAVQYVQGAWRYEDFRRNTP